MALARVVSVAHVVNPFRLRELYFSNRITLLQYRRGLSVAGHRWAFQQGGFPGLVMNIIAKRKTSRLLKKVDS
mgnify:CR=1 FL=1